MIRRQLSKHIYLLISQIEHARIAFEIARRWQSSALQGHPLIDDLLFAIEHHDDGWRDWEQAPDLEPMQQLPRSFTEMETGTAIAIWGKSIQQCTAHSECCGYWVSQHFCRLARQSLANAKILSADDARVMNDFQSVQRLAQQQLVEEWTDSGKADLLSIGTSWLRFFDHFSLLLCCRFTKELDCLSQPDSRDVVLRQRVVSERRIAIDLNKNFLPPVVVVLDGIEFDSLQANDWPIISGRPRALEFQFGGYSVSR